MLFKNKKDYSRFIIGLPIIFIFITAVFIGGLNIYNLNKNHNVDIEETKKDFLEKQRNILSTNVNMINLRLKFSSSQIDKLVKIRLKKRVRVARSIANEIYTTYKDTKTSTEIKKMIFTALNKVSWRDGRSYFWIIDFDGVAHMVAPKNRNILGKNLLHLKDLDGRCIIQDEINTVKLKGHGYLENSFTKDNDINNQYKQISFVRDLGFYDWYIGTAEFKDDSIRDTKKELIKRFSDVKINDNNYIFILELYDINGGDKFAKILVNKNRPDLKDKYLSDNYTDIKGKTFRKDMLKQIRKNGEAWVDYHCKKPDGTMGKKLSYFYLNKEFNWIVANGFYFDDLERKIEQLTIKKNKIIKKEIARVVTMTLILASILSIFSILLSRTIQKTINSYSNQLENLNKNLNKNIEREIKKNTKKDLMIFKQSKLAQMGEMIGNIAHQWRQPLNSVGATMMKLELINETKYDDTQIQTIVDNTNQSLQYMSKTIDDFRNFFSPNQEKSEFYAHNVIDEAISIIKIQLDEKGIKLLINEQDGRNKIYGHKNELVQVLLNIVNNAKDALLQKKGKNIDFNPYILITIKNIKDDIIISIKDNAGGIPDNIIEKVFDPYFTTKFKSKGTGIGMYMSKLIVEKDMNGVLGVENDKDGAVFTIELLGGEN